MGLDARALVKKYDLRAKKSWGQNFLVDERAYEAIVDACQIADGDWVIEIGAGLGTLTERLAQKAAHVIAVERDRDMVAVLRAELGENPRVEIAEANALTYDYAAAGRRVIVAGNLPYQIASPILFRLLDARAAICRMVIMLQKEMADRIVAAPSTPEYGALGVMVRMFGEAENRAPRARGRLPAGAARRLRGPRHHAVSVDARAGARRGAVQSRRARRLQSAAQDAAQRALGAGR